MLDVSSQIILDDYRMENCVEMFKEPSIVPKFPKAGCTTTACFYLLKDWDPIPIYSFPYYNIAKEVKERLGNDIRIALIGSNESQCNQVIDTNMPIKNKQVSCLKCSHWFNKTCKYKQNIDRIENGEIDMIFIVHQKLMYIQPGSYLAKLLYKVGSALIIDEACMTSDIFEKELYYKDIRFTDVPQIRNEFIRLITSAASGKKKVNGSDIDWREIYKWEEQGKARREVGEMILFLDAKEFKLKERSIVAYKRVDQLREFLSHFKVWLIDATGNLRRVQRYMGLSLREYPWKRPKPMRHFILVDESTIKANVVLEKRKKIQELGYNVLLLFKNKTAFNKYAKQNVIYATYYGSVMCRGTDVESNFMIMVDQPWMKVDLEHREEKMSSNFTQAADRVKDGNDRNWAFTYTIGINYNRVKELYTSDSEVIQLIKGSCNHIKTIVELLKDKSVINADVAYLASFIDAKNEPRKIAQKMNKENLYEENIEIIREYRRERRKEKSKKESKNGDGMNEDTKENKKPDEETNKSRV